MQKIVLWLEHALNIDQSTIYKILSTLLILFIGWVIYRFIHAAIGNRFRNMDLRYQWHKATEYYPLKYDKLTPIVYTSVRENGVQLTYVICIIRAQGVEAHNIFGKVYSLPLQKTRISSLPTQHKGSYQIQSTQPGSVNHEQQNICHRSRQSRYRFNRIRHGLCLAYA